MNEVIARIDISRPSGRKLVRELEKKRVVELEYPVPPEIAETNVISEDDFWKGVEQRFNERHGTNYKFK